MPKKSKGADKEKKSKKKALVNERETLSYEQQILDNNRQLARLRMRNQKLETEIDATRKKLQQLEEDRSDVIAHLKRNLKQQMEESQELNERLFALEELRKEELLSFKNKEEAMEEEYRTMENTLSAEIKLAEGKLNALEEWRIARSDLMRKFEIQEEQMAEQQKRHKETLYEIEKELIVNKAKMKKEMEERLNKLAQDFRDATNLRIADATHRAIRENIALNRELDMMFKICRDIETKMTQYKERDCKLRLQASLYQTEAKNALKKVSKQNRLINKLVQEHYNLAMSYGEMQKAENTARINEKLVEEYKSKCEEAQEKIFILEQHIEQTWNNKEQIMKDIEINCQDITKLKEILQRAKECIKSALNFNTEVSDKEQHNSIEKEQFLLTLLDILGSNLYLQKTYEIHNTSHDIMDNQYVHGNLGLVPCSHYVTSCEHDQRTKQDETCKTYACENGKNSCDKRKNEFFGEEFQTPDYFQTDSNSSDIFSLIKSLHELGFDDNDNDSSVVSENHNLEK